MLYWLVSSNLMIMSSDECHCQDLTDGKSTLVQVMAWCRQATCHYLNQCWPRSPTPYGVTRPQRVNQQWLMSGVYSEGCCHIFVTGGTCWHVNNFFCHWTPNDTAVCSTKFQIDWVIEIGVMHGRDLNLGWCNSPTGRLDRSNICVSINVNTMNTCIGKSSIPVSILSCKSHPLSVMMNNRMAWQWAETLVEIRGTLADIRGTTK